VNALILPAYAKLNLTLDVLGRHSDGYHEIASVLQTVSLHDLLIAERADHASFEASGPPINGENLVLKAARLLEERVGRPLPLRIRLHKRTPVAAGMGGGSADAAAFLRAATRLYGLALPAEDLHDLAARVGQDVPFLLLGGTALATGLGSTLERLPPLAPGWWFVVASPPVAVSTRAVYESVDGSARSRQRTPALVEALRTSRLAEPAGFGNDLEPATRSLHPELERVVGPLSAAMPTITMTGSGGAFFAAFASMPTARQAMERSRSVGIPLWLCRPVPAWA
jgi:4-diphosphocytidyl-2-C-methyl-D-erythritol kinase